MESHYDRYFRYEEHLNVFCFFLFFFCPLACFSTDYSAACQDRHCKSMGKWKPTTMGANEKNYIWTHSIC